MSLIEEIFKKIYLFFYILIYTILSFFLQKQKTDCVIIANHYNNSVNYIKQHPRKIFVVISSNTRLQKKIATMENVTRYFNSNLYTTVQQIIAIIQAEKVIIDDYYAPLYIIEKRKKVINIWHAYAIYKKIALDAPFYNTRNKLAIKRFKNNYQRIDELYVRSDVEKEIFVHSYKISPTKIYIDEELYTTMLPSAVFTKKRDKVVLYAPTYRPYSYSFDKVYQHLKERFPDYTIKVAYHQLTIRDHADDIKESYKEQVNVNRALETAEIFVTDYSSLLIEVFDLCKNVHTYQVIDLVDWTKYMELYGLNNEYYTQKIERIYINE